MWNDKLKELGVSIHIIATGAGAYIQNTLWELPGCSAYFSGASFPYAPEEHEELLGFKPDHYCSPEDAVDLASVAYMKAYRFGGKKPVGLGLTASVASEKEHRGDHRVHVCIITDDKILVRNYTLIKGKGEEQRWKDGDTCDNLGFFMIQEALGIGEGPQEALEDGTELARQRFFAHPYFSATGQRFAAPNISRFALMPGAFNPPHEGHFGIARTYQDNLLREIVFEITATTPHKPNLSVQEMLKRAKLLQGHNRFFTQDIGLYIEKARAYPGVPLIMGADAVIRMLDPKWGINIDKMFMELKQLNTVLYIVGRNIDDKTIDYYDIKDYMTNNTWNIFREISCELNGHWNVSSTEIRNKVI